MLDNCEAEWARSKESFDAVKKELKEKRKKCDHSTKLQEFRDKVDSIKLDLSLIHIWLDAIIAIIMVLPTKRTNAQYVIVKLVEEKK